MPPDIETATLESLEPLEPPPMPAPFEGPPRLTHEAFTVPPDTLTLILEPIRPAPTPAPLACSSPSHEAFTSPPVISTLPPEPLEPPPMPAPYEEP